MVELDDLDDHLVGLIQGLAQCSRLKTVQFTTHSMTTKLEQALVALVSKKDSALEELLIDCPAILSSVDCHECPILLEAVKSNYTVRKIGFLSDDSPSSHCISPWSTSLRENTDFLMRLNNVGRSYMAVDPFDKHKGFAVLEQTIDSLDCLLLHLQENPSLCQRVIATDSMTIAEPYKRAAFPALDMVESKRRKSSRRTS